MRIANKRIGLLTRRLGGGGAERVTVLLANRFVELGLDVSLLAIDGGDDAYKLDSRVKLHEIKPCCISMLGKAKRLAGVLLFIKKEKIDVAIALGGPVFYLSALKSLINCELIVSERNWPPLIYSQRQFRQIEGLYKQAAKVVFQTEEARSCFCEEVRSKSAVIPNPVIDDLPVLCPASNNKRVVAVGRLYPQKNFSLLIESFAKFLALGNRGYTLEIYGQGDMGADLAALADQLGVSESVLFKGFCKDVHSAINGATMCVSSSDFEGLQNSLIEAMSMGIPCIATDCLGGGAKLITDCGRRGLLVPCGDSDALSGAMNQLANDEALRIRLSGAGMRLRNQLSASSICDQWVDYIESD